MANYRALDPGTAPLVTTYPERIAAMPHTQSKKLEAFARAFLFELLALQAAMETHSVEGPPNDGVFAERLEALKKQAQIALGEE